MKEQSNKSKTVKNTTKTKKGYKVIAFRCPLDVEKTLKTSARKNHRSISGEINLILENFVRSHRDKCYIPSKP